MTRIAARRCDVQQASLRLRQPCKHPADTVLFGTGLATWSAVRGHARPATDDLGLAATLEGGSADALAPGRDRLDSPLARFVLRDGLTRMTWDQGAAAERGDERGRGFGVPRAGTALVAVHPQGTRT